MTKRIVDYDPYTRMTTTFDYDHVSDTTIIGREQNVEGIIEVNKALANNEDYTKGGIKESWFHCATIPNVVAEIWLNRYGVNVFDKNHTKAVKRLLNDPEWRYLKTTTKTV